MAATKRWQTRVPRSTDTWRVGPGGMKWSTTRRTRTDRTTTYASLRSTHRGMASDRRCSGCRNDRIRGPAMSCGLGVLVNARELLHQSKPPIEDAHANTLDGGCKPKSAPAGQVRIGVPACRPRDDQTPLLRLPKSPLPTGPNSALGSPQYPVITGDFGNAGPNAGAHLLRRSSVSRPSPH